MLHKTKGVVIGFIKYGDTSIIAKVYTELYGMQTYIVNGIRSKSSKNKIALFQPLTILDMVVYHKENRDIHRLSEVKCHVIFHSIPFTQKKISIAIFLAEVLGKTLRDHQPNAELFEWLHHSIAFLDDTVEYYENFHLQMLLHLAAFLGFAPAGAKDILSEIKISLTDAERKDLDALLALPPGEAYHMSSATRRLLLDCLLRFYSIHVENFGSLNSVPVLQEVLG